MSWSTQRDGFLFLEYPVDRTLTTIHVTTGAAHSLSRDSLIVDLTWRTKTGGVREYARILKLFYPVSYVHTVQYIGDGDNHELQR